MSITTYQVTFPEGTTARQADSAVHYFPRTRTEDQPAHVTYVEFSGVDDATEQARTTADLESSSGGTVSRICIDYGAAPPPPPPPPSVVETDLGRKITANDWGGGRKQLVVGGGVGGRTIYTALESSEAARLAELLTP